ncbi:hypothetical protein HHK36_002395 [Tetracentron sinense]|uniref:Trafficking protein particle complex subunit 11 domain-containing protein n=1 Tax=Tetracentron sinense TaxID=13715 RepID=A0A835DRI0_TETSI|nr:hypothetical protein HHK36_002395 [Tetracentron sinense]
MEDYAEELRTPPVSLVSLVGCPELHATISSYLHSEQPPINTLALPDFSKISVMARTQKETLDSGHPGGILKRDWILKHRTRVPAVVAALFTSDHVSGDPAQWLQVCTDLENLKAVVRGRNIKLVVVVVHSTVKEHSCDAPASRKEVSLDTIEEKLVFNADEVSEDRMIALRKRAEVDSKYLVIFVQNDSSELKQSLNRQAIFFKLGSIFAELSNTYYRDEGRRIKTRIERKSFKSIELNIRYCFKARASTLFFSIKKCLIGCIMPSKLQTIVSFTDWKRNAEEISRVAVYAEFHRDWVEALRFYEDAYHVLREMIGTSTRLPAIQRLVEIKTVAEQLHFKVSTLLLHGGKVIEAITWFRQHNASYRKLMGAPEVVFLHWEWMSRQFLVFAELLDTSSTTILNTSTLILGTPERPLTEWELHSAYYYHLAAHYLREKRSCLELALSASETANEIDSNSESVIPSIYVGQSTRLLQQGDAFAMQHLTDAEYILFALAEGKRFQDSFEIIALFKKSFESYSDIKAQRMASYCGYRLAREYFSISDFRKAKQHFDGVASLYRHEGWVTLLWEVLGYLRECSRRIGSVKDFIEYSLEMAALPISSSAGVQSPNHKGEYGPAGPASLPQREIIHKEVFELIKGESVSASNEGASNLDITGDQPLHLEIDLVSPLRVVLLASVAFHDQVVKPGVPTLLTLSLLSQLPLPVEIDLLEIQFNQPECNFTITNAQKPPLVASSNGEEGLRVENAPVLALHMDKWLRLTYDVKSEQSGKLECISVIARMGSRFAICCRAESPASMDDLRLWKFEDRVETFPTKDPSLAFSGQKAIQVEDPDPQVDLILGATGPALVGESFLVPVRVVSKGHTIHSGELKINIVDAKGGGLVSPREIEPFSIDSHHVELLGILGPDGEDESQTGPENIRKIQQSFGLLSVPFVNIGESWSCKLEFKWHRPKPVMLYVSLGYSPHSNEATAQKAHVHKSLQIKGKTAVVIGHRFMLPFRRDPLLLSKIKPAPDSDQVASLALKETSILIISAKNCSEVPLQLLSMSIEVDEDENRRSCTVQHGGENPIDPALLVPGEEFKRVFSIIPEVNTPKLGVGTVCLRWRRNPGFEEKSCSGTIAAEVVTSHKLPDINVEMAPLIVSLKCLPHAILGVPFTCYIRIENQTQLLQEVKYSLADSQSFVLSGFHNDTIFVLPKSEHILGYKLVPLASGSQQLPRFTLTSVRYSAELQPALAAYTVFVFPSKPHFTVEDVGEKKTEPSATE